MRCSLSLSHQVFRAGMPQPIKIRRAANFPFEEKDLLMRNLQILDSKLRTHQTLTYWNRGFSETTRMKR